MYGNYFYRNPSELIKLRGTIKNCPLYKSDLPQCKRSKKIPPVVNTFRVSQKYLIISSDPSSDTNKSLGKGRPHSGFSIRFLSLVFSGSDNKVSSLITRNNFKRLSKVFDKYFYWTHFAKCYSEGNPNSYCAQKYLLEEIKLFSPKLIILLGNGVADFLFGKSTLLNRVTRTLHFHGVPTYCSLHPSRNWNLSRRSKYKFNETWNLIRSNLTYGKDDLVTINSVFPNRKFV